MPPRRSREVKSTAPSPSPVAPSRGSSRSRSKKASTESTEESVEEVEEVDESPEKVPGGEDQAGEDGIAGEDIEDHGDAAAAGPVAAEDVDEEAAGGEGSKVSMAERLAKLKDLRIRMVCLFPSPTSRIFTHESKPFLCPFGHAASPAPPPLVSDRTRPRRRTDVT